MHWGGNQRIQAWVMPGDAQPCVSVGQKYFREGWGFYWAPFKEPAMVSPNGMCYKMNVTKNVPYLPSEDDAYGRYSISLDLLQEINSVATLICDGRCEEHHLGGEQAECDTTNAGGVDSDETD